jgi:ParB family chromosome partitioning protein
MKKQHTGTKIIKFNERRLRKTDNERSILLPVDSVVIKYDRTYSDTALIDLALSIKDYGILSPIMVRKKVDGETFFYELISGVKRLKAAILAGVYYIPSVVCDVTEKDSEVMDIMSGLKEEAKHFIEEAETYYCLMIEHGITQEELACRIGKSQSTIANKIRLLKLPPRVKRIIIENNLSERHSRCLLKIRDEQLQLRALKTICNKKLKVSKTELFVGKILEKNLSAAREDQLAAVEAEISGDSYQVMMCEIRSFINDLKKDVDGLRRAGVITKAGQFDKDDYLEFIVRIPKAENGIKKRLEKTL